MVFKNGINLLYIFIYDQYKIPTNPSEICLVGNWPEIASTPTTHILIY